MYNTAAGRLYGKSAIVTGAARGLGAEIARRFALEGANVMVNYHSSEKEALALVNSLKSSQKVRGKVVPFKADVSDASQRAFLVDAALKEFGTIDILVNNAGVRFSKKFLETEENEYDTVLNVNLKGPFFLCQKVAPVMLKQNYGKIINIASVSALAQRSGLTYVDYVCSKAGVIGLTRSLAVNLGPSIFVNAICPGLIETDMTADLSPQVKNGMASETLLNRFGKPQDIASAALFLASDESDFITGEIITVAGGRGMR